MWSILEIPGDSRSLTFVKECNTWMFRYIVVERKQTTHRALSHTISLFKQQRLFLFFNFLVFTAFSQVLCNWSFDTMVSRKKIDILNIQNT